MRPYKLTDPIDPVPAGYIPVPNKQLSRAIQNKAVQILRDQSVDFGKTVQETVDGVPYIFRKQMHGANIHHDRPHLGVSAFIHRSNVTSNPAKSELPAEKEKPQSVAVITPEATNAFSWQSVIDAVEEFFS